MRPAPIIWFGRALLLAAAIDLVNNVIALPTLARGLAMRGVLMSQPLLITSALAVPVLCLILWYCIARRRSVIAKWLLATYVALAVVIFFRQMSATPPVHANPMLIAAVGAQLLKLFAVICLFMPTAQPWFRKEHVA